MMNLSKNQQGSALTISLEGRLDTTTAPILESEIHALPAEINELVLDFEKLEYISSAGLRVLLMAQKTMNQQGKMTIHNVDDAIREVFDITGFSDILTVE